LSRTWRAGSAVEEALKGWRKDGRDIQTLLAHTYDQMKSNAKFFRGKLVVPIVISKLPDLFENFDT
jgi:hypothetical protein